MSSVFLDVSNKRKLYFRVIVASLSLLAVLGSTYLVLRIFIGEQYRPAVRYSNTAESYLYYYSAANKGKIALTFDDGPRYNITKDVMDTLEKENAPATFFFIGQNVLFQPKIVSEAAERGFSIGSHSFTHQQNVHESQHRVKLELRSTGYLISKITGQAPTFYRPPFLIGIGIDPTVNPYIPLPKDMLWSLESGYVPVGSDIDPRDWVATSSESVIAGVRTALQKSPDGHIMLLHEDVHTVEALPKLIAYLRGEGYTIVPLEELLTPPRELQLTQNLQLGDTDESTDGAVSKLQWFLYRDGELDPYLLTGTFGSETRNALTRFQLKNGLIDPSGVDPVRFGVADAKTRWVMQTQASSTLAAAVGSVPVSTATSTWHNTKSMIAGVISTGYVNLFPILRNTLMVMVLATLVLVAIRCVLLAALIFSDWFKKRFRKKEEKIFRKNWGVSVLIPAYNEAENIQATVESVVRSTYIRKEIIVIDDGSTDATGDIVKSVIALHPHERIKLIQVENGGKAQALNYGVGVARYEFCAVLDADAVLAPDALFHFTKHFADPNVGAVAGKVCTTGRKGFLDLFQMLEYAMGQNIDKRAFSALGSVGVVPGPAGAWRKQHIIAAGGFSNETLVEDQDMTLTLLRAGKKILYEEKAVAYTETPHTLRNFLKQRFRWIYGTMQCFWKHRFIFIERPTSAMSLVVLPNIFFFNILLPLTYPFADSALLFGAIFGDWKSLVLPFVLFTAFDLTYAWLGVMKEKDRLKLIVLVPLQRIVYRQLLYITVMRSVIRAIEGIGAGWSKFAKIGETQRFYFSAVGETYSVPQVMPEEVTVSFQGPEGTSDESTNLQEVTSLSDSPRQSQSEGETSNPA